MFFYIISTFHFGDEDVRYYSSTVEYEQKVLDKMAEDTAQYVMDTRGFFDYSEFNNQLESKGLKEIYPLSHEVNLHRLDRKA